MLVKIAWKNVLYKPMNSALCIGLIAFGVAIISLLLIVQFQFEQKFKNDLKEIDIVVGAKGSPLQLVLSAVYHLDAPTGNISLSEAQKIIEMPIIEEAIPMAYGDSYNGFRILGTTSAYMNKYAARIKVGRIYSASMEINLGASVANKTGLKVGDTFFGVHGEVKEGHLHENNAYTVVGILSKSNTVLDNLILTSIKSVWKVHSSKDENTHIPSSSAHSESEHDHEHEDSEEITALLLKCKSKTALIRLPSLINKKTNMQAALPGLEINRLFNMLGIGITTLKLVGFGIMLIAGFGVFFALYNRLNERKYEIALMRSVGFKAFSLFTLLLIEGILLVVIGYVFGVLLSRLGLYFINIQVASDFKLQFAMWYTDSEWGLLITTLLVGFLAAFLPAIKAMRIDVSAILAER